jgi:cytochrome P450
MVGAVQREVLRLLPPVVVVPKHTLPKERGGSVQTVVVDGKALRVPAGTFMHLDAVGTGRNPRYYPHRPSVLTGKSHDLDDFMPNRWLLNSGYHIRVAGGEDSKGATVRVSQAGSDGSQPGL